MGVDRSAGAIRSVDARSRVLLRVATAGLIAVLTSVTGGAVWAAAGVDAAVQEIEHVSGQGDAWAQADREVSKQESLGHAYLAEPSGDLRLALRETDRSLAAALDYLIVQGEADDAAAARQIKAKHAQSVRDLGRMLAAMDAGNTALAKAIHDRPVHPAYATLQHKIRAFADHEQQEVTEKLAELRRRQHDLRLASFAAAGVGAFALGVFLLLVVGYQRRLVRQALHDPLTSATTTASSSSSRSASGWAGPFEKPTPSPGWAGTSSRCCCREQPLTGPARWPTSSVRRCSSPSASAGSPSTWTRASGSRSTLSTAATLLSCFSTPTWPCIWPNRHTSGSWSTTRPWTSTAPSGSRCSAGCAGRWTVGSWFTCGFVDPFDNRWWVATHLREFS